MEVSINENANKAKKEKMSYEELENIAHQLSEQSRVLMQKLQEANMSNMFKRVDYLFKVLEFENMFSDSFIDKCAQEIQDMISIPEEEEKPIEEVK